MGMTIYRSVPLGQAVMAQSEPITIASDQSAVPISSAQLPGALVGGRIDENLGAWLGSTLPTVGSKVSASSVPVVIASDQGAVSVTDTRLPLALGQTTMANSLPVVLASNQSNIAIQGGAPVGITRYTSTGVEKQANITVVATRVWKVRVVNTSSANNYFWMIIDKAGAAVNGDVPVWEGYARQTGAQIFDDADFLTIGGLALANGFQIAASSTGNTLTVIGSSDVRFIAFYV